MRVLWLDGVIDLISVAILALALAVVWPGLARAQEGVFIQIESWPTLGAAESRARAIEQRLDNVNAFRARTGLYAIALGPYRQGEAEARLRDLLARGLVPGDSFLSDAGPYVARVFPYGGTALAAAHGAVADPITPKPEIASPAPGSVPGAASPGPQSPPQETLEQALQAENRLDRAERAELQGALQWLGQYQGTIDGAFGPATRDAIWAWQRDAGFVPTGILSTAERDHLLRAYRTELDSLGMAPVRDPRAGIEIDLPMAMVSFDGYNFPFVQFAPQNDSGVQVLLISQPGDRASLSGLYAMMETLDFVPPSGARDLQGDGFVLTGQSERLRSHTEARLIGGAIKGFALVWPPRQDARIARILPMMQASFRALEGVLDPGAVPQDALGAIDLATGSAAGSPARVRSGFFIDADGHVITTSEAVAGTCTRILIDMAYQADIAHFDDALGLAVLRPLQALAPLSFAEMSSQPGPVDAEIAVAGFPFDGALGAASMAFGRLADLRGIHGEPMIQRLAVATSDSEAGGPVFDMTGAVVGMVLPDMAAGRTLPRDVTLALRADLLSRPLGAAGITPRIATRTEPLNPERLARLGAEMTVSVSCWN